MGEGQNALAKVPKYLAVKRTLLDRISRQVYGPTERLPTDVELGKELGVSPMTARRALQELVDHGLIVRSRGRGNGTFLQPGAPPVQSAHHQGDRQRVSRFGVLHRQKWENLRSAPVFFQTFLDVQAECARRSMSLELLPVQEHASAADIVRIARKSGCQALIVMDWHDSVELMQVQEQGLPIVVAGSFQETAPLSFVEPNDCQGAYAATRHLLELGHPAVGLLEHRQISRVSAERRVGWQMAAGVTNAMMSTLVYRAGQETEMVGIGLADAKAELREQFRKRRPPTALFARDGFFAYAAIAALAELGIKCPDDISVTCVGRYYEGVLDMPRMTSAQMEDGAMGREVVRLAEELATGQRAGPVGVVLPMHLVGGKTTSPYAGRTKSGKAS